MLIRLVCLNSRFGRQLGSERAGLRDCARSDWSEKTSPLHIANLRLQQKRLCSRFAKRTRSSVLANLRNDCHTSDETLTDVEPRLRWAFDARCKFLDRFPYEWNLARNSHLQNQPARIRFLRDPSGIFQRRGLATKSSVQTVEGNDLECSKTYHGVYKVSRLDTDKRWCTRFGVDGLRFENELAAAVAHDILAHCLGEMRAKLNFPFRKGNELAIEAKNLFEEKILDRGLILQMVQEALDKFDPWPREDVEKFVDDLVKGNLLERTLTKTKYNGVLRIRGFPREVWGARNMTITQSDFRDPRAAAVTIDLVKLCLGQRKRLNFTIKERSEVAMEMIKKGHLHLERAMEFIRHCESHMPPDLSPLPESDRNRILASVLDPLLLNNATVYNGLATYMQRVAILEGAKGKTFTEDDLFHMQGQLLAKVEPKTKEEVVETKQTAKSGTVYCGDVYIGEFSDPSAALVASDLAHLSFGAHGKTQLYFRSHRLRKIVMRELVHENLLNLEGLRRTIMDKLASSGTSSLPKDWKPLRAEEIEWLFMLPSDPIIHPHPYRSGLYSPIPYH